jgi:hypothetical protein
MRSNTYLAPFGGMVVGAACQVPGACAGTQQAVCAGVVLTLGKHLEECRLCLAGPGHDV